VFTQNPAADAGGRPNTSPTTRNGSDTARYPHQQRHHRPPSDRTASTTRPTPQHATPWMIGA